MEKVVQKKETLMYSHSEYTSPAFVSKKSFSPAKSNLLRQLDAKNSSFSSLNSQIFRKCEKKPIKIDEEERLTKDIRVGKKLSDLTTKRVSVLVMVLIFVIPLFDSGYYYDNDKSYTFGIKQLARESSIEISSLNSTEIMIIAEDYVNYHKQLELPLIYLYLPSINFTFQQEPFACDLRFEEKEELVLESGNYNETFTATISTKSLSQANSILNILRTIYLSIVLGLGAYLFTKDTNDLALKPIARMIEKVNKIASNPLATKDEVLIRGGNDLETISIENAIIKIGTLLALGFGDAGSQIIAKNIAQGGDVDPMLPGHKEFAIFGFCDIRNFTDSTEVLQEDVMVFVNKIAYIVHKTVDKYVGIANKNIGDAFLLLWKFEKEDIEPIENNDFQIKRNLHTKNLADFAIISFLKIICKINYREEILQYRTIKSLLNRMPDYKVKMGFGLHLGWAIEGAIGSVHKIDASYLSPNVNIASRLEAATKQYGVNLLVSNELIECCSRRVQRFCREIDRVTVKGSLKPLGLFTLDLDVSLLEKKNNKGLSKEDIRLKHKFRKENILEQFFKENGLKASMFFEYDESLNKITQNSFGVWRNFFFQGFEKYISGNWSESNGFFTQILNLNPLDGPTTTLLNYIKNHNYVSPDSWPGYRELIEK